MSTNSNFDIVSSYRRILNEDPELTMPVAAIEALVEAIAQSSVSTVAETLELLERHTAALKASIANPISLSAGTDLFQRYLITTLNRPASLNLGPDDDFRAIRNHLLSNGKLFVERAKQSREKIASFGKHFIRDGATVLTNGGSRVVGALLRRAAESSTIRFKVIYVVPSSRSSDAAEGDQTVSDLRAHNVPVATISDSAVAYSLGKVDMVIVGAEGVVENGGIISRMGTYQMGLLAKSKGKPFYVVAESHKFVRLYPLSQFDLPIEQKVLDFKVTEEPKTSKSGAKDPVDEGIADMTLKHTSTGLKEIQDAVDFTVRTVHIYAHNMLISTPASRSDLRHHHRVRRPHSICSIGGADQDLVLSLPRAQNFLNLPCTSTSFPPRSVIAMMCCGMLTHMWLQAA
jgi:translation initiation factor eIF-2B subunit alpha